MISKNAALLSYVYTHKVYTALLMQHYGMGATNYVEMKQSFERAVKVGDVQAVSNYLAVGTAANCEGRDLLYAAVEGNQPVIARLILRYDNSANIREWRRGGNTPLHCAAEQGDRNMITLLLQYGADPRVSNDNNQTPAYVARAHGYKEAAKLLAHSMFYKAK